ncbi:MAG: peptidoglycan-binding domain-containing protein [Candidatus Paceibacterota bacterium]
MKKIILSLGIIGIFAGSTTIVSAGYFNNTPVYRCNSGITQYLSLGSENDSVYVLQQALVRGGYLYATPNGYFGYATRQAVKSFQRDNGIYANGVVNEETRESINEQFCGMSFGYPSGVTYVDQYDPYVRVISPDVTPPFVYTTPETYSTIYSTNNTVYTPVTNQVQNTNIIYNPYIGYTYGIVPQSGSLTISSPLQNSSYIEGDVVYLAWSTNNLNATQFSILIENASTGQSKTVGYTTNNNYSFVLTKDILDSVCSGACDNNNSNSYRIVITTQVTDIAGITSTMRSVVSPISIKRPYGITSISINSSKTPVNSGEKFKLYVNIPTGASWNSNMYGQYSFKIRAICPPSVQVSIAGTQCGQDFSLPVTSAYFQQEIPAVITNNTYYRQDVIFEITAYNFLGQVTGTSQTTVISNAAPFNW